MKTRQKECGERDGMTLGLGISNKKAIPRNTEYTEQMVISDGIPVVLRNRKLSEFLSEPFCGRGNNSEFRSIGTKIQANSRKSVPNPSAEEKLTQK